ncbi:MAG: flagellar filament capping protein FliD [Campylobacterales bacterium]
MAISALGLGSGTLTSDLIDKLKNADISGQTQIYDQRIQKNSEKNAALTALISNISLLKSAISDLSDATSYQKRTATSSSSAIEVSASDGVTPQTISIQVNQIAKNDVYQSTTSFSSSDAIVRSSNPASALWISVGGGSLTKINVTAGMTLEQLAETINSTMNGDVIASVIDTGIGSTPYKLIIRSANVGADYALRIFEQDGLGLGIDGDSDHDFVGTTATPSTNTFSSGTLTINGVSIGAISTDASDTAEETAQKFADAINEVTSSTNVAAMTDGNGKLRLVSLDGSAVTLSTDNSAEAYALLTTSGLYDSSQTSITGVQQVEVPTSDTTYAEGSLIINGVSIGAFQTLASNDASANAQLIADAINQKSADTKVTATVNNGVLTLTNSEGGPILITSANGAALAAGLSTGDELDTTKSDRIAAFAIDPDSRIQKASNARIVYNGLDIERSSNTITDLVAGLTLTLKNTTTSEESITISRDNSSLSEKASAFTSAYNTIVNQIAELTKYDETTKSAGVFLGVSEITTMIPSLNNILFGRTKEGVSATDFGFETNEKGIMTLNTSTFAQKLSENPDLAEELFYGKYTIQKANYTGVAQAASGTATIESGTLLINGVDIGTIELSGSTAEENAQTIMNAINAKKSSTGVTAYTNGDGKLMLSNKNGKSIYLKITTAETATLTGLSTGVLTGTTGSTEGALVAYGSSTFEDGIFASLNTFVSSLISGTDSTLMRYSKSLTDNLTADQKTKQAIIDQINQKYERMSAQFAQYDALISKYQQISNTIQMQIDTMKYAAGN